MAYEVIISTDVLKSLDAVVFYLERKWTANVAKKFLRTFYKKVDAIAINPSISRKSSRYPTIRKFLSPNIISFITKYSKKGLNCFKFLTADKILQKIYLNNAPHNTPAYRLQHIYDLCLVRAFKKY
jgi:plasmid stabilization system protein ParE